MSLRVGKDRLFDPGRSSLQPPLGISTTSAESSHGRLTRQLAKDDSLIHPLRLRYDRDLGAHLLQRERDMRMPGIRERSSPRLSAATHLERVKRDSHERPFVSERVEREFIAWNLAEFPGRLVCAPLLHPSALAQQSQDGRRARTYVGGSHHLPTWYHPMHPAWRLVFRKVGAAPGIGHT